MEEKMKRELRTICLNAKGADFEKLYKLCNSLFPRHKHKGYLKENGNYDLYIRGTPSGVLFLHKKWVFIVKLYPN